MPSKSVSFSDEAYSKIISEKPDNMNFSEWIETATVNWIESKETQKEA